MGPIAFAPNARVSSFESIERAAGVCVAILSPVGVVLVIAGGIVLGSTFVAFTYGALDECKTGLARDGAQALTLAVEIYRENNGSYPSDAEGLAVLVQPRVGRAVLDDDAKLKDPWGREYRYGRNGSGAYPEVRSAGPDGFFHTDDDIGNWSEP